MAVLSRLSAVLVVPLTCGGSGLPSPVYPVVVRAAVFEGDAVFPVAAPGRHGDKTSRGGDM